MPCRGCFQMHEAGVRLRYQLFRHGGKVGQPLAVGCEHTKTDAQSYANGQSEIVMGQAIKKYGWKRSDIVISTKVSLRSHRRSRAVK
jgi:diketogulonate reductase-like aldo/keto reductase